jgi:hypothetical protein
MEQQPDLNDELERLQGHLPGWAAVVVQRTMCQTSVWVRIPAGVALTAGGVLGFLPIVGFWMAPLGLALIAQDVPFMRPPLARGLARINRRLGSARE